MSDDKHNENKTAHYHRHNETLDTYSLGNGTHSFCIRSAVRLIQYSITHGHKRSTRQHETSFAWLQISLEGRLNCRRDGSAVHSYEFTKEESKTMWWIIGVCVSFCGSSLPVEAGNGDFIWSADDGWWWLLCSHLMSPVLCVVAFNMCSVFYYALYTFLKWKTRTQLSSPQR